MGEGEYGGNGSVHWNVKHGNGSFTKCTDKNNAHGVDADPASGGYFTVEIDDVLNFSWDQATRTLTATTAIKHGAKYTKQVSVKWP